MTSTYASSILRKTLCHASRSKKPQNQTQRADFPKNGNLQKPKPFSFMLILLALLCGRTVAWGQDPTWQTRPANVTGLDEWDGRATSGTFKVKEPKVIPGRITVNGTLKLYPVGNVTITRGVFPTAGQCVFDVESGDELYIIGDANNKLTIDGGAGNREDGLPHPDSWDEGKYGPAVAADKNCKVELQHVIIEKFSVVGSYIYNRWGVINCCNDVGVDNTQTTVLNMKNVEIRKCYGGTKNIEHLASSEKACYGRIISIIVGKVFIFMDNVEIHHCLVHEDEDEGHYTVADPIYGFGGIIRSQGNSAGKLEMKNCNIHDNQYRDLDAHTPTQYWNEPSKYKVEDQPLAGQGGAINWRSGRNYKNAGDTVYRESELIIRNCNFVRNCAKEGGAISTCAKTTFKKDGDSYTYISKNHAEKGGGLIFWPYNDGQPTFFGDGFKVALGGDSLSTNSNMHVRIFDNFASKTGGGVYIVIDPSDDIGFDKDNKPRSANFEATFGTGCEIRNNRAPQGAGVSIIDNAAMKHKGYRVTTPDNANNQVANPVKDKWSGVWNRTITFDGATVKDNFTSTVGTFPDKAEGAGIYIVKKNSKDSRFSEDFKTGQHYDTITTLPPGGLMTVNVMSGVIRDNHARQYKLSIVDLNQNDYSPFTDTLETTNPKPGKGGGFYIGSLYDTAYFKSTLNVNIGKVGASDNGLQVYNNDAYTDGGGLYIYYDRDKNRDNGGDVKVLNGYIGKTSSETNKALNGNGGGLCVLGGTVTVGGGHVLYNTAANGYGGGIYVNVPTDNSVTYINASTSNNTKGTNISYNSALGGGGVYVDKGILKLDGPAFASGTYGQTQAVNDTTHTRLTNNKATNGNGGGIDAGNGTVEITNTLFYSNKASGMGDNKGRGGGVYLNGGTIKINTSKILFDTAYLNGGGIDDHFGSISITGGDISNNTAINGGGGGVYTHDGDITVWPDYDIENTTITSQQIETQVMPKGTKVDNNKAGKNGGGLNTHKGRFDVRFATITNNKAGMSFGSGGTGGNGGGLFCEGPHTDSSSYTVRLLHCHLNDNKAYGNVYEGDSITGRGGGIYLKFGSIFAEHCDILRNEADINGGGLDNHEGELRVYGSYIDHNKAKTGKGGGIYTEKGNIVVGPCDSYGYTSSKASRIYNNTAKINGGGINNHEGNITIHGDRINNNTAETGNGGGVYINSGKINMYGGQINNNKADQGKGGGVYGGSGRFKIMEREPHPILEILEMENVTNNSFTVHFHHVDRGLAMDSVAKNKEFGIAYSTNAYPDLPENQEWTTTNWTGVKKITFNVADGNSDSIATTHPEGKYTYVRNEGCSRVIVDSVSAVTTYYVVAYGKYSNGDKNYFDASPAVAVKTYNYNPVVVTGVAFGITTNSASVNGKLLFNGAGTLLEKGIEISSDNGLSWVQHPAQSVGNVFSVTFSGLESSIIYKARAYAVCQYENHQYESQDAEIIEFRTTGSKAPQGPRSVYPAVDENPFFMELTPLQQAMLVSTPEADSTPFNIPQINKNTARYGGGICIDMKEAELIFAGSLEAEPDTLGQINLNYASEAGGGIYIGRESADKYAMMQMMGKCEVNKNRVPAGKLGGGIYLDGRFYVGDKNTDRIGTHGLKVDKNFAIDKEQTIFETELDAVINGTATAEVKAQYGPKTMNNVFLPRSDYDYKEHGDGVATTEIYNKVSVITLLSDVSGYASQNDPYSHIGFSVPNGFCPVIATSNRFGGNYEVHEYTDPDPAVGDTVSEFWLYNLMSMAQAGNDVTAQTMKGAVFEDSESYVAIHTRRDNAPFRLKYIYLWGCWTHPIVKNDPETKNPMSKKHGYEEAGKEKHFLGHYKIKNPGDYTGDTVNGKPLGNKALEWEIYSPEGLAWFSSYVNGLNVFDESGENHKKDENDPKGKYHFNWSKDQNPKAKATIMNDLDMSAYLWVPIGSVQKFYQTALASGDGSSLFVDSDTQVTKKNEQQQTVVDSAYTINAHYYRGTFDGQGHIIKGLQGLYLTGIEKFGLFGYLADSAVVKNTFVDKGLFVSDNDGIIYSAGGITGTMKLRPLGGGVQSKVPVISNSEARMNFNATYSAAKTSVGGLVGNMNNGHIHSCMAMPTITTSETTNGQYVGGLVGKMDAGTTLKNSFSNVLFTTTPDYKVGGIAGENNGLIENVYVRYNYENNTPNLPDGKFYWIAGSNTNGEIKYPYTPNDKTGPGTWWYKGDDGSTISSRSTYTATHLESNKYGFAQDDQKAAAFIPSTGQPDSNGHLPSESGLTYDKDTHTSSLNGLMGALNNWVEAKKMISDTTNPAYNPSDPDFEVNYSTWTRTMASTINDDYPVLMFNDFNVVGTEDGIYMKYDDNVNDMWKKPNYDSLAIADRTGKNFQGLTSYNNPKAAMYLYKTNGVTAKNSTPVAINVTGNTAVRLYIHENVGITQTDSAKLHARVGVTFDNSDGTIANGGAPYDWHMFSSALQAAPMGLEYYDDTTRYPVQTSYEALKTTGLLDNNTQYHNRSFMDPPRATWYQSDNSSGFSFNKERDKIGYFPTNTPYGSSAYVGGKGGPENTSGSFDFYCFDEETRHWINFKRKGADGFYDHWHLDAIPTSDPNATWVHHNIEYENEETMQVGKGYMMGVSAVSMLMADGILNNGTFESDITLTNSEYSFNMSGYSEELRGTNLVGNPFQSYLDFNKLADANSDIYGQSYYVFDADSARYLTYTAYASENPDISAPGYIHPHQGFFVKTAEDSIKLTFNNTMRSATGNTESYFRNKLNYPLVNLFCYDAEGHYDVTTVEMNRPELGGGSKLKDMRNGNSLIYARMENEDYQTLFAPTGTSTVPVRFEPSQDGVYTMRWGTLHGDFHYLHLIDNMSGADVDMLRSEEYRFEATTTDYLSRFKLVFEVTGLEEEDDNEDDNGSSIVNFAFRMGDELIVNGAGYLEVFDVQGRRLSAKRLVDAQSSVSLPNVAAGIYFLRLSDDKQVRTQKMVINY